MVPVLAPPRYGPRSGGDAARRRWAPAADPRAAPGAPVAPRRQGGLVPRAAAAAPRRVGVGPADAATSGMVPYSSFGGAPPQPLPPKDRHDGSGVVATTDVYRRQVHFLDDLVYLPPPTFTGGCREFFLTTARGGRDGRLVGRAVRRECVMEEPLCSADRPRARRKRECALRLIPFAAQPLPLARSRGAHLAKARQPDRRPTADHTLRACAVAQQRS